MSLFDYRASQQISATDPPFYALIMAAIRKADTFNMARLRAAFPEVYAEFEARYNAPGGVLSTDPEADGEGRETSPAGGDALDRLLNAHARMLRGDDE